jgi:hypothetical protein
MPTRRDECRREDNCCQLRVLALSVPRRLDAGDPEPRSPHRIEFGRLSSAPSSQSMTCRPRVPADRLTRQWRALAWYCTLPSSAAAGAVGDLPIRPAGRAAVFVCPLLSEPSGSLAVAACRPAMCIGERPHTPNFVAQSRKTSLP